MLPGDAIAEVADSERMAAGCVLPVIACRSVLACLCLPGPGLGRRVLAGAHVPCCLAGAASAGLLAEWLGARCGVRRAGAGQRAVQAGGGGPVGGYPGASALGAWHPLGHRE